jgi:cohesin loading factor subunit SCC2
MHFRHKDSHLLRSLRDGRSIRTVSALLLQLVQTSAHDVRSAATKIGKSRQQVFALRRQDSNNDVGTEAFLDENDAEVCLTG